MRSGGLFCEMHKVLPALKESEACKCRPRLSYLLSILISKNLREVWGWLRISGSWSVQDADSDSTLAMREH
jgi:hypothetical protein